MSKAAFERNLLVETSGPKDEVVKLLPALTTTDEQLDIGIATLRDAIAESA
ncbi:Probable diaminobutyrate--2-oxoglutarate aminotransferase [Mycobacteroides abscessus subsp. massiliense]|nr:Probable diaminobutyrate--2-oxoglutarate aminotransferase [Mycobacteroides abscessus subsp. massiliense]